MSQLSVLLQETARTEAEVSTILGLLREHVEDLQGRRTRTLSLKERLGFRGVFGCCGAAWGFRPNHHSETTVDAPAADPNPPSSGMNLAAALAAERQLREANLEVSARSGGQTPERVSLMRLLEETDDKEREREGGGEAGSDTVCCVCMVRKKGAAFIPCGHTYCRVCSREVWLNRGNCPLCNRSILEILDLF